MSKKREVRRITLTFLIITAVVFVSVVGSAALLLNMSYFDTGILEEETNQYQYIGDNVSNQISATETIMSGLLLDTNMIDLSTLQHNTQSEIDDLYDDIAFGTIVQSSLQDTLFANTTFYTSNPTIQNLDNFETITSDIEEALWYQHITLSRRPIVLGEIDSQIFVLYRFEFTEEAQEYMTIAVTPIDKSIFEDLDQDEYTVMISNLSLEVTYYQYGEHSLLQAQDFYDMFSESTYYEDEMVLIYTIVPGTTMSKWNLILVTERVNFVFEFAKYASLIFVFLAAITYFVFHRSNLIKQLNRSFDTMSPQDIQKIVDSNTPNRMEQVIKNLYEKVELLVQRNQELSFINKQKEAEKTEAEIKALLTQINPHYIFNLLNSIHKRALQNNEVESAKMILLMSKQLRRSLEWSNPFVTIKEELEHIKSYIKLQQHYYGETCDVNYDVEEHLYDIKVPKLIFQTLIENALKHGARTSPFYIQLKETEEYISFSMTNIVEGKPQDAIKRITQALETSKDHDDNEGIGLQNMIKRLEYYYKSTYKVITQAYKQNVSITILLPKLT